MRSEHDQFVCLVRYWNFCDDIERIQVVVKELVLNVHLEAHLNLFFNHSPDAAILLGGHYDLCGNGRVGLVASSPALYEESAAAALAGLNRCNYSFIEEKL